MIPLIETAFEQAIESAKSLNNQASALLSNPAFAQLFEIELVREIECTPDGMLLHPMRDPRSIVTYFQTHHQIGFSRERMPNDTYDWITVWPGDRGFALWIVAGEVFNMTGTVITPNSQD